MRIAGIIALLFVFTETIAQTTVKRDPQIQQMVEEVSAQNLEILVKKLASFGTRHTLSDTISKTTCIGAARN